MFETQEAVGLLENELILAEAVGVNATRSFAVGSKYTKSSRRRTELGYDEHSAKTFLICHMGCIPFGITGHELTIP